MAPREDSQSGALKDSVPPHNDEAEKAVLGAILLNTDPEAVTEVFNVLKEEDFYRLPNRILYAAVLRLANRHDSIDLITLKDELKASGVLQEIDIAYLASLTTGVPSSANVEYYAKIVRENSIRRRIIRTASYIGANAYDGSRDLRIIIDEAETTVLDIASAQHTGGFVWTGDLVLGTINVIEKFYYNQGKYTGIPSGYEDLDNLLSGFQNSELIIIGARPSVGKTALALCMAANMAGISARAGEDRYRVGFFSLEMSRMAIMQRLIASEARISSHKIRTGYLQEVDFSTMVDAGDRIQAAELYISDAPAMKLLDMRAEARRMRKQKGVQIIFIDYLGLIQAERKDIPRWEQFSEISMSLKALARELDIPIIAMSQLGRQVEKQEGYPSIADLRESGSIEQDADVIMLLDRERKKKKKGEEETEKQEDSPIELRILDVAKQRNGPTGRLKLKFYKPFMRFESYTEKADTL